MIRITIEEKSVNVNDFNNPHRHRIEYMNKSDTVIASFNEREIRIFCDLPTAIHYFKHNVGYIEISAE